MPSPLKQAVDAVAAHPQRLGEILATVETVYQSLAADTAARKPRCDASGRCCNFDGFGHRLYVTTLELIAFSAQLASARPGAVQSSQEAASAATASLPILTLPPACPFQVDRLCSVHPIRPFGCRIFFCDPTATEWQNERYEQYHAQLKAAHTRLNVPYFYVEWRQALIDLQLA
jgi:Fe-S-cluster containining protein